MKNIIDQYYLKEGFFISLLFPAIFFLLDYNPSNILAHFIFSFIITFCFWVMNFIVLDFKRKKLRSEKRRFFYDYKRIIVSFILSILTYIFLGFLLQRVGGLLSQARGNWATSLHQWIYLCVRIILFDVLIILIKYLLDSNAEKRKIAFENEILKRENLDALHETLKQQVNPHFLFNSLNTLKSLIKRNTEQAVNFVEELSSVYRYMLLHQDKKMVTLGEEIAFLKSYLYLLKIRFGEAISMEIKISPELMKDNMPPNTLQLLIENAVKHNALSVKKPLRISIFIKNNYLAVQNNLQPKAERAASSHVGLSNISNRYVILKGKQIIIEKDEKNFLVLLPLN